MTTCLLCRLDNEAQDFEIMQRTATLHGLPTTRALAEYLLAEIDREIDSARRFMQDCGGTPEQLDHFAWAH